MISIDIKKLMSVTFAELEKGFKGKLLLKVDDGEEVVTSTQLLLIHIMISVFNKHLPFYKLSMIPKIGQMKKLFNEYLRLSNIRYGYSPERNKEFKILFTEAQHKIHSITWELGNKYSIGLSPYDYAEPYELIKPLMKKLKHTPFNLNIVYDKIERIFKSEVDTNLALLYNNGLVKKAQVHILFGPRGVLTDTDGRIYNETITNSLLMGLCKPRWFFYESRTLAKSHFAANSSIAQSDKMAKMIRWGTTTIENINMVDCGSTKYFEFEVKTWWDFEIILGRFMKTDDGLIEVTEDMDLVGETVLLRSILTCNAGGQHVCATCYGTQSRNINPEDNLGVSIACEVGAGITTKFLATKHHIGSVTASAIKLDGRSKKFFEVKDKSIVPRKELFDTESDVEYFITFKETIKIPFPPRLEDTSRLIDVIIKKYDMNGKYLGAEPIQLTSNGAPTYFTREFLNHFKKVATFSRNTFSCSIKGFIGPMLLVQEQEYSYKTLTADINRLLLNKKTAFSPKTVDDTVNALVTVLRDRMFVPLSVIELLSKAFSVNEKGQPARLDEDHKVLGLQVLQERDLATLLSSDNVAATMQNVTAFKEKPIESPMGHIYLPNAYFPTKNANRYFDK